MRAGKMDLLAKIKSGEGRKLEFKVLFTSPAKIAQTAIAFANGAGGEIIFGVADGGGITGLHPDGILQLIDQLSNLIYENCYPLIMVEITIKYIDTKAILVMEVFPGGDKPYYLKKPGKANGVFIRVGASTRHADSAIINDLERRKRNISYDEEIAYDFSVEDLDLATLKTDFQLLTGKVLDEQGLYNLKIIKNEHGKTYPTVGGMLLAGKVMFNDFFGVKCARFKGNKVDVFIDKKEYSGPLYKVVEDVVSFAKNYIPLRGEIHGLQRVDQYEVPILAIREAVINAIIHRDYTISGSSIKLAIFDDIVEITSPGCLPNTLSIADIINGRSEIRNKVIARFFEQISFIEQWGTGVKKIIDQCHEFGLSKPSFTEGGNSFQVTLFRKDFGSYDAKTDSDSNNSVYEVHSAAYLAHKSVFKPQEYNLSSSEDSFLRNKLNNWLTQNYAIKSKQQQRLVQILASLSMTGKIKFDLQASKRTCE
jgi:ATP-dependent DNA helicase RecG